MNLTKVDTYAVKGRNIEIFVNPAHEFRADMDGNTFVAPTFDGLKKKLIAAAGTKKLNIAVTILQTSWRSDSVELTKGVLYGVHSNGNLLINSRGSNHQVHNHEAVYLGFSPHEAEEFNALLKAKREAIEAYEKFLEARRVHAHEAREALDGKGPLAVHDSKKAAAEKPVSNTRKVGKKR